MSADFQAIALTSPPPSSPRRRGPSQASKYSMLAVNRDAASILSTFNQRVRWMLSGFPPSRE